MDTSLGALRARLFSFRSWDSTGPTLNARVNEAINSALERVSGDVPEAVVPDDEHVVLQKDAVGTDATVAARIRTTSDTRVLEFTDASNAPLTVTSPWVPDTTGTFDGIMHLELTDSKGERHRRQCLEFWIDKPQAPAVDRYYVTIDRPWETGTEVGMPFRLHQPEFFVTDDVTRVLEPARIYDETRQQVWAIDTGGAYRQDMERRKPGPSLPSLARAALPDPGTVHGPYRGREPNAELLGRARAGRYVHLRVHLRLGSPRPRVAVRSGRHP